MRITRERCAVRQRHIDAFHGGISTYAIQPLAGECSAQFESLKAGGARGAFAGIRDKTADALTRPVRMNEEGSNARRIDRRIEQVLVADSGGIGAE